MTLEDFQSYRAILKEPLLVNLNDNFQILTQPLPSSGILISSILKIMNGTAVLKERIFTTELELKNGSFLSSFQHDQYARV